MYLRQARARDAERMAQLMVVTNRAFAGGDGATQLLRDLNKAAGG